MATYVVNHATLRGCNDTQGMENIMRITLIAAVLALTGFCLPLAANAEEKVMSVEWYRAPENSQALEEKLRQCRENPEQRHKDKNCQNAADAAATRGRFQKVKEPPIPVF